MVKIDNNIIKWVWLDIDDTLIDFETNSLNALREVYHSFDLSRYFADCQDWIDLYHRHNKALWVDYSKGDIDQPFLRMERFRRPLVDAGCDDETARKLSDALDPVYLDILGRGQAVIAGAHELLDYLRGRGYKIGVLSNGFKGVQQLKLDTTGMTPKIDLVVLSDDIDVNKPDVRLYEYAMSQSGCDVPSSHIMIGDNPDTDIAGAVNAGWQSILFSPSAEAKNAHENVISTLLECIEVL